MNAEAAHQPRRFGINSTSNTSVELNPPSSVPSANQNAAQQGTAYSSGVTD
jgi:hypothetical protein